MPPSCATRSSACARRQTRNNMTTRKELLPGVFLTSIQDGRFKTACFSLSFLRPLRAGEAAMNALLPSVLLRGSEKRPPSAPSPTGWTNCAARPLVRWCAKGRNSAHGPVCRLSGRPICGRGRFFAPAGLCLRAAVLPANGTRRVRAGACLAGMPESAKRHAERTGRQERVL